ncbi:hypothetical protein BV25DRAFT_209703 [Artomyces pyxidatus]|uniref:Uncharacterized protein n=1 Tax=Artomyces pyxidatus TaxID=48021 RepID=A0ACB8T8V9_9AGAM|nr:hypothetical protein BV25DRAFT_209703 [Artomyces pyxidatus]
MNADYSKLFSSGLRVMAQRRQRRTSGIPSPLPSTPTVESSPSPGGWKKVLPVKLVPRSNVGKLASFEDDEPAVLDAKRARRRTVPSMFTADDTFNVRIWDKASSVPHPPAVLSEDDEPVDPFRRKSIALKAPMSLEKTPIYITLPDPSLQSDTSFFDFCATPQLRTRHRSSIQMSPTSMLPTSMQLPSHPYRMAMDEDDDTIDEDFFEAWNQFRVEWITLE